VHEAPPASWEALLRVHPPEYLDLVRTVSERGGGALDADTFLNDASWEAAVGGAGALLAAVHHALEHRVNAFAAIRPPGHHALANAAMGFCLLANVVIAAREAQRPGGTGTEAPRLGGTDVRKVLIVDWDIHHGNGTQALIENDPSIRFVSLHRWPFYPGTGAASERGAGNVFNLPRPPGLPPEQYVSDLLGAVENACADWTPGLILVSAGYDSMRGDPLGGFTLEPGHYSELVHGIRRRRPDAPIVGALEGGYDPARTAEGLLATVQALG
jgi:acetoin utilization deacetylase AcuC-like enzyme